jgi:DNA-binding NarL/FixJ family response regulator
MPINIAIAEDNRFALKGLLDTLGANPDLRVKHVGANGKELLRNLKEDRNVDLVLMDIEMPEMNGIEATAKVKSLYPQIKVLMLTAFDDDQNLFNAILAGASGYLLKEDTGKGLLTAITDTLSGGAAMSPAMALKTLQLIRQPMSVSGTTEDFDLTTREIELLTQLKSGLTYEEIGVNLHISRHTVRKHIENIYRKLQVSNKVEAIRKASENRIV